MGGKVNDELRSLPYPDGLPEWSKSIYDFDTLRIGGYDYHKSWDWLMPVCNRWDNLQCPDEIFIEYERRTKLLACVITQTWSCNEAFIILAEAIQWYNAYQSPKQTRFENLDGAINIIVN